MLGYTRQVARELATRNVRVNCVLPGYMDTPMATGERRGLTAAQQEDRIAEMARGFPMQRIGTAEDISAAVAYLASDDARYVTGHELVVDRGFLSAPPPGGRFALPR
jgi:NAD(P)-dependent dehydrogenase (short-subunit alcohol dehydrogenase family)